ncbi:MAG TPA: NAD(P)-dependent oxidoreductase [Gemmatimonadaceae bacterium]|nr:NAD(P)-dependent oxidoreductase [Gemmatimonadaceae bacterium]
MRVVVTGGAGYVGSTLVPILLGGGHQVRVLDSLMHGGESLLGVWANPAFEFHRGDVRDEAAVRSVLADADAVVHLAAIVGDPACARDPSLAKSVNLEASLALLAASRAAGVKRFIFASTCSNYGKMADSQGYVDERSPLAPVSLYAETKVGVERAMLESGNRNGTSLTAFRFATVFGVSPRMRFDLTVNEFTAEMIARRHLVVFGEQFWRPYVHVRDAARAIALCLESPTERVAGQVFNVGSTNLNYRKQDLVELIRVHAPDARIEYVRRDEDPRDYRVSFARISETLGYSVTRSVEEGIEEVARLVRGGVVGDFNATRYRN